MALPSLDADAPSFVHQYVNLADARLGAEALSASDDFFADKARMLNPEPAVFIPGKYDQNGKWMDGWESRRKRGPGHDWCIVRLARPGTRCRLDGNAAGFLDGVSPGSDLRSSVSSNPSPEA